MLLAWTTSARPSSFMIAKGYHKCAPTGVEGKDLHINRHLHRHLHRHPSMNAHHLHLHLYSSLHAHLRLYLLYLFLHCTTACIHTYTVRNRPSLVTFQTVGGHLTASTLFAGDGIPKTKDASYAFLKMATKPLRAMAQARNRKTICNGASTI